MLYRCIVTSILVLSFAGAACSNERPSATASTSARADEAEFAPLQTSNMPAVTTADLEAAVSAVPKVSALVISQRGEMIYDYYANGGAFGRSVNIKSASKSIVSALTGIALARGDLDSLDTPISLYLPQYFKTIPKDDLRRSITVRHLLTMSSGLPSTSIHNYGAWVSSGDWIGYALRQNTRYPPGTRMTYSTGDTHLLAAVLTNATGMPLRTFAQRYLFDPLNVQLGGWDRDPQGIYFGGNNLALSPSALLRFGQLYLNGGSFEGRRLLPRQWIDESWTPRFANSSFNGRHDMGYLWWRTDLAGRSTWFAWGYGGQFLLIVPSLDAVVVITRDPDTRTREGNDRLYGLMERVVVPYLARRKRRQP